MCLLQLRWAEFAVVFALLASWTDLICALLDRVVVSEAADADL